MRGRALAADSGTYFEGGLTKHGIFIVAGLYAPLPAAVNAPPVRTTLLRSRQGDARLSPVRGAAQLAPTVVAVNPVVQDEVWTNDIRPGRQGGGLWRSVDSGDQFDPVLGCCATAIVYDIDISPSSAGFVQVLVATNEGLKRSIDDGASWTSLTTTATYNVRTVPDSPDVVVARTEQGMVLGLGPAFSFSRMTGLDGCSPSGLRRNATVPTVFLVDCGAQGTFRATLQRYAVGSEENLGTPPPPVDHPPVVGNPTRVLKRSLVPLATWPLPASNSYSGAIAFDGRRLYYDDSGPTGLVRSINARTGAPGPVLRTKVRDPSFTVDLRRNELIATGHTTDGRVSQAGRWTALAYSLATGRERWLTGVDTKVPTYDAFFDGASWISEASRTLYRAPLRNMTATKKICDINFDASGVTNEAVGGLSDVSTFVASGDGGGYLQMEDDMTVFRIDRYCARSGPAMVHRRFSESQDENDTLVCDTQTFFPKPAIWIRDSVPGTVTAYAMPFGYCPMPSTITPAVPVEMKQGVLGKICARLTNATTGEPGAGRPVVATAASRPIARGTTDLTGRVCMPYTPGVDSTTRRLDKMSFWFAGDSALYPSTAAAATTVVRLVTALPALPVGPAAAVIPPPGPLPGVPNVPAPNPGPAPAQLAAPNPAAHPVQAPVAQSQPVTQALVVPQRQTEPQLVFARAATTLSTAVDGTGTLPMTTLRNDVGTGRPKTTLPWAAAALGVCFALGRRTLARAPARRRHG